jgi:probable rRNA maturation factor
MTARKPLPHIDVQRHSARWRNVPGLVTAIRKAVRRATEMSGVTLKDSAEISVSLADDAAVRAANRNWRAKDKPTNVLSFPATSPHKLGHSPFVGDIIIAHETVVAEAENDSKTVMNHTLHLVVHGVLHLLGYDHMTNADAARMEALETRILESLGLPDPYAGSDPVET